MNLQVEPLETHEVRLIIDIDDDTVSKARRDCARTLSKQVRVPGFRPGNAPVSAIVRAIGGEQVFEAEVAEVIAKDAYPKALDASGVKPYGPGAIEEVKQSPYQLIARVPVEPTVDLKDYLSVRLPFPDTTVTQDEIEHQLQLMREDNALVQVAERPAELGDLVEMDVHAYNGSEDAFHTERRRGLVLDDARLGVPGLANLVVGMSAGEDKQATLHIPDDFQTEQLRGKDLQVHINVSRVSSRQLPEINDELAQTASSFSTLPELREDLLKRLSDMKNRQATNEYAMQALDEFAALADVKYPPQFVDDRLKAAFDDFKDDVKENTGLPFEEWLKVQGKTEQQVKDELRPGAEHNGKRGLVMNALAQADHIDVNDSEIASEVEFTANRYGPRQAEVRKLLAEEDTRSSVKNNLLSSKILNRMVKIARGEASTSPADHAPEPVVVG